MSLEVILYLLLYKSKKITLSSSFIYVYIRTTYFRDEYFTLKTNMEAQEEWKYSQHTITAG